MSVGVWLMLFVLCCCRDALLCIWGCLLARTISTPDAPAARVAKRHRGVAAVGAVLLEWRYGHGLEAIRIAFVLSTSLLLGPGLAAVTWRWSASRTAWAGSASSLA